MRVVGLMPRGPRLPLTNPAATTASTPLKCNRSAMRYDPKATIVVMVISMQQLDDDGLYGQELFHGVREVSCADRISQTRRKGESAEGRRRSETRIGPSVNPCWPPCVGPPSGGPTYGYDATVNQAFSMQALLRRWTGGFSRFLRQQESCV